MPHYLRNIVYTVLFWFALTFFPSSPSYAGSDCGTLTDVLRRELTNGYAFLATAETERGLTIVILINQNHEWEILGVDEDAQNVCVVSRGSEWFFAMDKAI